MCFADKKKNDSKLKISTPYEEGIYFDMPEEEYHKIPYFSRGGCEYMVFDPSGEEYWHNSSMNPEYMPIEQTPAMALGAAIHCMVLEPRRFDGLYVKRPTLESFQGKEVFKTSEDIKAFLDSVGEKKTGKKEDLIARALPYLDPKTHIIWDNVIEDFENTIADGEKREISENNAKILKGIREAVKRRKNMTELLNKIRSEITIIWKDEMTGLMCKCRLDGARPEAIIEVKSYSVKNKKKSLKKTLADTISYDMYNLQFYVYKTALETIIKKIKIGKAKVFGDVDKQWLDEFLEYPNKQFFILYFRTQAPFQCEYKELERAAVNDATANVYYSQAQMLWEFGITNCKRCFQVHGVNRWIGEKDGDVLSDEDVPNIIYQSSSI